MLTVITSRNLQPEIEPVDRDPGIVALVSRIVRCVPHSRYAATKLLRGAKRTGDETVPVGSSTIWPYVGSR